MSGRKGSSGHQNLIRYASKRLLDEMVSEKYLSITLVREQPLDVKAETSIKGERFGAHRVAHAELRMYADIACAAVFTPGAQWTREPILPEFVDIAEKKFQEGDMVGYYDAIRSAYGVMIYLIECEINPRSGLLRDGPKLTAYKLIKQQNNNLTLILAVFEGTKVDNPGVFDEIWTFPRRK